MNESNEKKKILSRNQWTWGLTAFLVLAFAILFFFIVYRWEGFSEGFANCRKVFQPFLVGAVLAWLVAPLYNICEEFFRNRFSKKLKESRTTFLTKLLSTLISIFVMMGLIYAFFAMVIPGLIQSVSTLVNNSQRYLDTITGWGETFLDKNPSFASLFNRYSTEIYNGVVGFAKDTLLPKLTGVLGTVSTQIIGVFKFLINFIIGIFACIYILNAKRTLSSQAKRIIYSVFGAKKGNTAMDIVRFTDRIFYGFVSGKVWDSLIIGIICFIGCSIMKMPYTLLVSVVVGITNIIPCFGPFIGAVPSALLILVEAPVQALYFIVFILVLQQIDGNVIGPKILGDSVGISPLWILFSIVVFGGFFGFWGMLLGVPIFTCIYTLCRWLIRRSLMRKNLPSETNEYDKLKELNPETGEAVRFENGKKTRKVRKEEPRNRFFFEKRDKGKTETKEETGADGKE